LNFNFICNYVSIMSQKENNIIKLNVGGIKYETTLNTLTSDTNSMLANMFSGRHPMKPDNEGYHFIDRDGKVFDYIIKYLRDKKVNLDNIDISIVENIKDEAVYFNITGLVDLCSKKILSTSSKYNVSLESLPENEIKKFEIVLYNTFSWNNLYLYTHRDNTDPVRQYDLTKYYLGNKNSLYELHMFYATSSSKSWIKYHMRHDQSGSITNFISDWVYYLICLMQFDPQKLKTLFNQAINGSTNPPQYRSEISFEGKNQLIPLRHILDMDYSFIIKLSIYKNDQTTPECFTT
jgi:hypothetical protein